MTCRQFSVATLLVLWVSAGSLGFSAEPKLIREFAGNTDVRAISPDGKTLALAKWDEVRPQDSEVLNGGELIVIDFSSDKSRFSLKSVDWKSKGLHGSPVKAVFSPDGKWLAVASAGLTIKEVFSKGHAVILDTKTGEVIHDFRCRDYQVQALTFSPDSKTLITCSGYFDKSYPKDKRHRGVAMIWDVNTGKLKRQIPLEDRASNAIVMAGGKQVIIGYSVGDNAATVHEIASGKLVRSLKYEESFKRECAIVYSPRGRFVLSRGYYPERKENLQPMRIWLAKSWDYATEPIPTTEAGEAAAMFSPDERLLLTFSFRGKLVIRETKNWKVIASKQLESPPKDGFTWGEFFNNGHYLVVKTGDKKRLWDLSKYVESVSSKHE